MDDGTKRPSQLTRPCSLSLDRPAHPTRQGRGRQRPGDDRPVRRRHRGRQHPGRADPEAKPTLARLVSTYFALPCPLRAAPLPLPSSFSFSLGTVFGSERQFRRRKLTDPRREYSLASRVVYNFVYVVAQDNRKTAAVRPLTWGAGIAVIMSLFLSAARNST